VWAKIYVKPLQGSHTGEVKVYDLRTDGSVDVKVYASVLTAVKAVRWADNEIVTEQIYWESSSIPLKYILANVSDLAGATEEEKGAFIGTYDIVTSEFVPKEVNPGELITWKKPEKINVNVAVNLGEVREKWNLERRGVDVNNISRVRAYIDGQSCTMAGVVGSKIYSATISLQAGYYTLRVEITDTSGNKAGAIFSVTANSTPLINARIKNAVEVLFPINVERVGVTSRSTTQTVDINGEYDLILGQKPDAGDGGGLSGPWESWTIESGEAKVEVDELVVEDGAQAVVYKWFNVEANSSYRFRVWMSISREELLAGKSGVYIDTGAGSDVIALLEPNTVDSPSFYSVNFAPSVSRVRVVIKKVLNLGKMRVKDLSLTKN
jgi:hypothetical protein